jgi:hypothetical protein
MEKGACNHKIVTFAIHHNDMSLIIDGSRLQGVMHTCTPGSNVCGTM